MAKSMLNGMKGRWALVTGASAGIGQVFCRELAAAGLNLVAVARRESRLRKLAQELEAENGVQCLPLPIDLESPGSAEAIRLALEQREIEIALLVNNAGVGQWGRFEEADPARLQATLAVNAQAAVSLCRVFHDHLQRQSPHAAVINVSSQAALQPVPYMAVYAASKAFMHNFSLALYEEWKGQGIHVQTLIPGPTESEFDRQAGAYESKVTRRDPPEKAVRASLRGLVPGKPVVASVKGVFTQRLFAGLFPPGMVTREVAKMFRPPGSGD